MSKMDEVLEAMPADARDLAKRMIYRQMNVIGGRPSDLARNEVDWYGAKGHDGYITFVQESLAKK